MTSIVHQFDKKTGITYAVESTSHWDKEKKMCVCTRKIIGHFDPETGEILPNRGRHSQKEATADVKSIGCDLLFSHIANQTELKRSLQCLFPRNWDKLLTCAYYSLAAGTPLSRCESWSADNRTPHGETLSSQRIAEMLPYFSREEQLKFFKEWGKIKHEKEYFALDITSISSYSEMIKEVKYGYNRDGEKLPQINLAMLVGEKTGLPIFFQTYPGSIHDVSTLQKNLSQLTWLDGEQLHVVMDRGFASKANISALYAGHFKFTLALPRTSQFARGAIEEVRETICSYSNRIVDDKHTIYTQSSLKEWDGHRCYTHVYYNQKKVDDDIERHYAEIDTYYAELTSGRKVPEHQKYYDRYFPEMRKQKGKMVIVPNDEAMKEDLNKYAGFMVLISNDIKDPVEALRVYRDKDVVEKAFDNLKNDLDGKRLRVWSAPAMEGRMFVQFVSLIIASQIQRVIREKKLAKKYSMQDVIDEMSLLKKVVLEGRKAPIYSELTAKQKEIVDAFGIEKLT